MYCWTVDDFQEQPYAASDANLAAFTRRACPPFFTVEGFRRPPSQPLQRGASVSDREGFTSSAATPSPPSPPIMHSQPPPLPQRRGDGQPQLRPGGQLRQGGTDSLPGTFPPRPTTTISDSRRPLPCLPP